LQNHGQGQSDVTFTLAIFWRDWCKIKMPSFHYIYIINDFPLSQVNRLSEQTWPVGSYKTLKDFLHS
jgi:hypothetical protein